MSVFDAVPGTTNAIARNDPELVCVMHVNGPAEPWLSTLSALRRVLPEIEVVVGAPDPSALPDLTRYEVDLRSAGNVGQLVNAVHLLHVHSHVLVIAWPVILPPDPLRVALELAETDLRCSSVSFFCNAAGYLSFPHRDHPWMHQIDDLDEVSITRRLRDSARHLSPAVIPYASGPALLLTAQGLSVVSEFLENEANDVDLSIATHSCRTRCHGMVDLLDPTTFVLRPRDITSGFHNETWLTAEGTAWLSTRYPGLVESPADRREHAAGFADVFSAARAAVGGLRIVIDGSVLGARETGIQVTVLAMVKALADRSEIASIGVSLPVSNPPRYAVDVLRHPKVDARYTPSNDLDVFGQVDIIHRPFQGSVESENWRRNASRVVMTLHDLVAYQVPIYHETPEKWFQYREDVRLAASDVDGLVVISADVRRQVSMERLRIEEGRLFVVPNGVGHLTGSEPADLPRELMLRGFDASLFLLVIGTDYAHKNRGKAVEVLKALRDDGHQLSLVLAGAHVPYGSSRMEEYQAWTPELPVFVVPDVSSEERNWLLRHASVVLYPTSAEGFGLVPHEAAAFGTPTVFVPFGPFAERFRDLPVAPADWSVEELVRATDTLLRSPSIAQEQVNIIARDTERYDWTNTAAGIVDVYRAVLGRPARHGLRF